ncbi:hypothetical protein ACWD4J_24000 [Streptomyces sp. NPDC002577]
MAASTARQRLLVRVTRRECDGDPSAGEVLLKETDLGLKRPTDRIAAPAWIVEHGSSMFDISNAVQANGQENFRSISDTYGPEL